MQWAICFDVPATDEPELQSLPPPTKSQWSDTIDGKKSMLRVMYFFEYPPQSWREWQRIASVKVQIKKRVQRAVFREYNPNEITGHVYTISELGRYFKEFIKWPQPLFPSEGGGQYKMLCRHAKRLHYQDMLHLEQLIATSIRFNESMKGIDNHSRRGHQGHRQVMRLAKAAYQFAQEHSNEWKQRLLPEKRHDVLSESALKSATTRREKSADKRERAKSLRNSGETLSYISTLLQVNERTVRRWTA